MFGKSQPSASSHPTQADYVIVGGGSAGAVLANRLSENPGTRVVLLEAGGDARSLLVELPIGFTRLVGHEAFDWKYEQEQDPSINGRHYLWSAGRLLGGGSSINGQVFIRGTKNDFGRWEAAGATGWGFSDVLPYFLRAEQWHGKSAQNRGAHGPMSVSPMRDYHPLARTFLASCAELGLPTIEDYNDDGIMEGAFLTQTNQRNGLRCSTEKAYLRPIKTRSNLRILTHSEAEKVLFDNGRATGVIFRTPDGMQHRIEARREVIVSSGTMGSPALLMRSGLGPAEDLQALNIPLVKNIPQIGKNLQEHSAVAQHRYVNTPTLNSQSGVLDLIGHALKFALQRKGAFTASPVHAMALARTREGLSAPDIHLNFLPLAFDIDPDTTSSAGASMPKEPAVTLSASLVHPKSRGRVVLDTDQRPRIVHQLLGDARDVETLVDAMKLVERLFNTQAFSKAAPSYRMPSVSPASDQEWADFVRAKAIIAYHAVGTCRMGSDAEAVVDTRLRVRGVDGLRVVDASIMPEVVSVNTNATTIMIGEKAAEMIRDDARAAVAAR
jgi:choline dehydrogenase